MQALGAEIIALSADEPQRARMTVAELGLTFPILSDSSRKYIRDYDVLHPQEGIARPSMFVVDREGIIRWKHVGMNAADRPPMADVLEQLRAIH